MPTTLERWTKSNEHIGLRWQITRSGDLRVGWPPAGLEDSALALGWMTEDAQVGVIEQPAGASIDIGILEILEERFPNRRWYTGTWDTEDNAASQAA